jgi:hypothetical protein
VIVVNSVIRLTSHDITNSLIVIVNHYKQELFMAAFNCEIMYYVCISDMLYVSIKGYILSFVILCQK